VSARLHIDTSDAYGPQENVAAGQVRLSELDLAELDKLVDRHPAEANGLPRWDEPATPAGG
jgi:hypothetical protein